jgi:thiamine transport system substrate-binding protein
MFSTLKKPFLKRPILKKLIVIAAICGFGITTNGIAADKLALTVYTYDAFAADWGPGPKIKAAFEIDCGCVLNFVATDSSLAMLRKVQLEGTDTKADIVLGLDTNISEAARKSGLFAFHKQVMNNKNLPLTWSDWTFVPFDYGYFAFVYDSQKLANPPKSFAELAARDGDFKIVIQDPRSSTPGLGLLLWIKTVYGDKAADYWRKLKPRILTVTKGWSEAYGLFLKGEADMVLSYTTSPAYHLIVEKKDQYKAAEFTEGHYMQVEVAGMLKSSKNPELARLFLKFISSKSFQQAIPTGNWMYPVSDTGLPLPKGFETLHVPSRPLLMRGKDVEKERKAWIAEWLDAQG